MTVNTTCVNGLTGATDDTLPTTVCDVHTVLEITYAAESPDTSWRLVPVKVTKDPLLMKMLEGLRLV